jgi:ceramide glucosyltransferase
MMNYLLAALQILFALGALAGISYYVLCLFGAWRYLAAGARAHSSATAGATSVLPGVSILKPLKGVDPQLYESFRSHCLQDYPEFELVFGVSDPEDAAIDEVRKLQREFPERSIQLVICPQILGTNVKVSNLVQMLPAARHNFLIVNDSDIRVPSDYLRRVVPPLLDENVGMVTCLYRGVPCGTLGSRLESLGISTDFAGGVLAARALEGVRFGLGSTLVFRRKELDRIGGFQTLLDYLADDYQLGRRIVDFGLEVRLSSVVVDTFLPAYDLRGFFEHQLRWARSVRDSRRWGYIGLLLTFGSIWSALTVLAARGAAWAWWLFGVAILLRIAVAFVVGTITLKDRFVLRLLPLLLLRDISAVLVWFASFASDTIAWRGSHFRLKDGKLYRVLS